MKTNHKTGPLSGLKVLDLSRVLAGPWASQVLADYGADIWKIENPQGGDETRHWGNLLNQKARSSAEGIVGEDGVEQIHHKGETTAYFLCANRGKYSLTVDITTTEGQQIIHQLAAKADIVLENFKVGNLKKYHLDYESLQQINNQLIYCSITGFGQTGPFASQAGYDAMIQASAGLMSITGEANGNPQKVGVAVSDLMTGMYAVSAILAALYHRQQSGQGQYIDLALFDTQVGWLANQSMQYLLSDKVPEPQGSVHPNIAPYQPVSCKDTSMMLAVGNERQFKKLCELLDITEIADEQKFCSNNSRIEHREELILILEEKLKQQNCEFWISRLSEAEIPCGPINTIDEVFKHPQIEARNTLFRLKHKQLGTIPQVANPVKFSKTEANYQKAPPTLGEDTQDILQSELNYSAQQLKELADKGII